MGFAITASEAFLVMVAFGLEIILAVFRPFFNEAVDDGLRLAAPENQDIANFQVFRLSAPDKDKVTFVEAALEREILKLLGGNIFFFIPGAADLPVVGERIFEVRERAAAELLFIKAVLHALGEDSNNGIRGAHEQAEKRINNKFDKDKSEDKIGNPAPGRIIMPEETPGFFKEILGHKGENKVFV